MGWSDEALATAAADNPAVAVAMTLAIRTSRRLALVEDGGAFIRLTPVVWVSKVCGWMSKVSPRSVGSKLWVNCPTAPHAAQVQWC